MKPYIGQVPENIPAINVKQETSPAESPWKHDSPTRYHMDAECYSITRKFQIYAKDPEDEDACYNEGKIVEGYFVISYYADGYPGRVLIYAGKQGEETHGWTNSLAKSISLLLQYGVPLEVIYDKLMQDEYEPRGVTNTLEAPICKSILDLILKYMRANFPPTAVDMQNSDYSEILTAVVEQE